ncbi:MAG: RDD family protein [Acidimicrobiales bacterium]|nr:RDD family protein [Acidimicrobiales bacterium]
MSDTSQGPGWWQASDGKWYPPEQAPGATPPAGPPAGAPMGAPMGAAAQGNLADWGTRASSYVIDYVALGILGSLISNTVSVALGSLVSLLALAFGIYNAYLNGATGRSVGKKVIGTMVVSEETGQPIGGGMGIVRWLAHIVDSLACLIGWFWPIWDEKRQTFADKIVKTVVITGQPKQSLGEAITSG